MSNRERLFNFWTQAQELGLTTSVDQRRQRIIKEFLSPQLPTLKQLRKMAGVTSRERVRQLIVSAVEDVYQGMPDAYQQANQLDELTRPGFTPETRARMSEAHRGREHTPETRARMSEAFQEQWGDEAYRTRFNEALKRRRHTS